MANPFMIQRVTEAEQYIKLLVYGASGVGKTHLAATAQECEELKDVLFLDAESGASTLVNMGHSDIDVVAIKNWQGVVTSYEFLKKYCVLRDRGDEAALRTFFKSVGIEREKLPVYKTVVLDTLDEIQDYCMKNIQGIDPQSSSLGAAYSKPGWPEYGEALERMRALVRNFRNLPLHIIFTCHQENKQDDMQRMHIMPSLTGKFAVAAQAFFDFVGFYAARTVNTKEGPKIERKLFIAPGQNFDAKNRCKAEVGFIAEPTMQKLLQLMKDSSIC